MYFVVVTGIPNGDESYISMVDTERPKGAHAVAISEFRRKNNVDPNIHIRSEIVFRSKNMAEATLFMVKLSERIAVAEEAMANE